MKTRLLPIARLLAPAFVLAAVHVHVAASQTWNWSYAGTGVAASGTFTTGDVADAAGYYTITGITGQRNGIAITGLQAAGTSIPGNAPFVVDNLIRPSGTQLTGDGFGFSLANGTYVNPFFASFLPTPGYLEFFSAPPFSSTGPEDSELPITFQASIVAGNVPEPATWMLMAMGVAGLVRWRRR